MRMTEPATQPVALLVEDEALVAMVAEDYLVELGFAVRAVTSGAEALALGDDGRLNAQLAIIDVGLPDMRGDDLARQLRRARPQLNVVMASGYDPVALEHAFAHDSRVRVVGKPYTEDDLIRAVRSLGFEVAAL